MRVAREKAPENCEKIIATAARPFREAAPSCRTHRRPHRAASADSQKVQTQLTRPTCLP